MGLAAKIAPAWHLPARRERQIDEAFPQEPIMNFTNIELTLNEGVATITLNRPDKLNS
ncbi:hypothetical protein [Cupriavidus necator]|uniref:hypothetical protein n=1 Tax=Cupriavidus necator TaxID=106590 RepID=UPI000AE152EA|nr:hypothetical protein [Cupriavidus necator]